MTTTGNPVRILLADDHSVLRAGLRSMLNAEADMQVVGEAEDGQGCVLQAMRLQPDIILLDINMPRCNGLEALTLLRQKAPQSRVLVLTMHDDAGYLRQVLSCGGAGYVLKQAAGDELLSAIRAVHGGGVFLHPQHTQALLTAPQAENPKETPVDERYQMLSERESEIFKLIALGHRNSEIADMLCLSVKTVETYKSRLMQKLGITTRSALVRLALELGVLTEQG
jgi:two-component system, NarL family, response regulator NreC